MANKKVGMQELHILLDKIKEVQDMGHYVAIRFGNYGCDLEIYFKKNGFKAREGFDFDIIFSLSGNEEDCEKYQETMEFFEGIINPPAKEMTLTEIEKQLGYKVKIVGGN